MCEGKEPENVVVTLRATDEFSGVFNLDESLDSTIPEILQSMDRNLTVEGKTIFGFRNKYNMTPRLFSLLMGVSANQVECWELGLERCTGPAARLFMVLVLCYRRAS